MFSIFQSLSKYVLEDLGIVNHQVINKHGAYSFETIFLSGYVQQKSIKTQVSNFRHFEIVRAMHALPGRIYRDDLHCRGFEISTSNEPWTRSMLEPLSNNKRGTLIIDDSSEIY